MVLQSSRQDVRRAWAIAARPQGASGRVCFLASTHFSFDVRIRVVSQSHLTLKAAPVFAQVMPQPRQISPALGNHDGIKRLRNPPAMLATGPQMSARKCPPEWASGV